MDDKITARLRVVSSVIKDPARAYAQLYGNKEGFAINKNVGEVVEIKANGEWESEVPNKVKYPISLHITVYPGCGAIPCMGDDIEVTLGMLKPSGDAQSDGALTFHTPGKESVSIPEPGYNFKT